MLKRFYRGYKDSEPKFDALRCMSCNYQTEDFDECPLETDGDWETGYFEYAACPKKDCIGVMEGEYTRAQYKKWIKWGLRQNDADRGTVFEFLGPMHLMIQLEKN